MESTSSSSPSPNHRSHPQFKPVQPFADRVVRALCHHLRLLHRSNSTFYVLGATGNVYTVTLSITPTCTCPDRTIPCKHILFVFLRVLGIGLDDPCLRRRTLRPCQLARLLGNPTSNESLAGARVRERFHQISPQLLLGPPDYSADLEDGATCPICLEVMIKEDKVVSCRSCRNPLHEECLLTWKRAKGRRSANCVMCRARWRDMAEQDRYLNLAAYVTEDDMVEGQGICGN
ncbi:Swim zinc finger family protein [Thalictrum thalictroides]|uniref:Swim zinc finger family protein n=1 Tax=Thalictrum thalictroides TaxID=46969 RepID=A0A7J6XC12_THATH|nr:Swim zinc finger family protein [Thalictrum thalictroides]